MSITNEDLNQFNENVVRLVDESTKLTAEIAGQKQRFEDKLDIVTTKASEANASATSASDSRAAAMSAENQAKTHATSAELSALRAKEASGLATVEQAVSQALADGGYTWRTEADMIAMREQNNAMFAASGFVHTGRHWFNSTNGEVAINEGLQTYTATPQILYSGVHSGYISSTPKGISRTFEPIINLGGFITHIEHLGSASQTKAMVYKFPEAEAGTRVYDSVTGVSIDYAKEADPKYGDIAPTHNEAVARAFEGIVENGDMRLDDARWVSVLTTKSIVNGALRITAEAGSQGHRVAQRNEQNLYPMESGTSYIVECNVRKGTYGSVYFLHSCDKNLNTTAEYPKVSVPLLEGYNRFVITPEFTGDELNGGYGLHGMDGLEDQDNHFDLEFMYVRPVTEEVVTDRVDMFGIEGWLEEITTESPFVYLHGVVQSNAPSIDGIPTAASNRPDSYYAAFKGDTTSRGKGVNFLSLSVIEQDQIANNPKNNIFRMHNGDVVQWRIRQRSIAGLGNGDWVNVDPASGASMRSTEGYSLSVTPSLQGRQDAYLSGKLWNQESSSYEGKPPAYGNGYLSVLPGAFLSYSSRINSYSTHDVPCYFLVCGLVSRLNKGGHHPSLNPMGANPWKREGSTSHSKWHIYDSLSKQAATLRDAFDFDTFVGDYSKVGQVNTSLLGRMDGKMYDAIYSSGQGGVIDERLKYGAWDASSVEQSSEVREEVKNGTYRGREKLKRTKVYASHNLADNTKALQIVCSKDDVFLAGDFIYVELQDGTYHKAAVEWQNPTYGSTHSNARHVNVTGSFPSNKAPNGHVVHVTDTNVTVEGEFNQTDVAGNPENIVHAHALKDGWIGDWIKDFGSESVRLTRKSLSSSITWYKSDDIGATWVTAATNDIDPHSNELGVYLNTEPNRIGIIEYTAFARQTKPSDVLPVLNRESGLGNVFATNTSSANYGCLLGESLLGVIGVQAQTWAAVNSHPLNRVLMDSYGKLQGTSTPSVSSHGDITLVASNPAYKALPHQIEENGQASLGVAAMELVYDDSASSWGDNGAIKPAKNSTFTDDNGNICKIDHHKLAKPYGYIKNNY